MPSQLGCWEADPGMDGSQLSVRVVRGHLPDAMSLAGGDEIFILVEVKQPKLFPRKYLFIVHHAWGRGDLESICIGSPFDRWEN